MILADEEIIQLRRTVKEAALAQLEAGELLASQLADLEPLSDQESGVRLDIALSPADLADAALAALDGGHRP